MTETKSEFPIFDTLKVLKTVSIFDTLKVLETVSILWKENRQFDTLTYGNEFGVSRPDDGDFLLD